MKRTLLISAALLTFACGHASQQAQLQQDASTPAGSAQPRATVGATGTTSAGADEMVTLVGCLKGPALAGAAGTAGSPAGDRARSRGAGNDAETARTHGGASTGRFTLVNVIVASGGVGANGAGGSGGPVVSARSAFELDGLPADGQASVNKQVRVTGRVDSRAAGSAAAATGAGLPSGGSTSTRDDVRANSTTAAGADASTRRLTVETVQVVAQSCAQQ